MSTNNIILDANVAHSIRIHWSRSNIDHPSYIQMPCIISWSLGISLKCSLHYLLLVPLSVVLNMIRGDLSEWILDTHSQIIQLMECLQTPQVGLFLRINLAKKDSIKVLAGRNCYCSATKATTAKLSVGKIVTFFVKFLSSGYQWYLK